MPHTPRWLAPDVVLLDARCPLPLDRPFTRTQAATLGVGPTLLRAAGRRQLIRQVVHGAYAVAQLRDTIELRTASLALVVAAHAVVTDRTAAWVHEVDVLPRRAAYEPVPLDLFSAADSRLRRRGVSSGVRSFREDELVEIDGLLVSSRTRTALDLGRTLWRYDAIGALDAFLRIGVPRHELEWGAHRFKGYRGIIQLRELLPLADGRAESMPESALRLHGHDAGLPALEPQHSICDGRGIEIYRLDLAVPSLRYAADYHGERFHTAEEDRAHDEARAAWLDADDWEAEAFWKEHVYGPHADPQAKLRAGIERARARWGRWRPQGGFLP